MAIKEDGSLWNWGWGRGLGIENQSVNVPTRVGSDNDWAFVSAGGAHSLAIKTDGTLWIRGEPLGMSQEGWNYSRMFSSPTQVGTDTDWVTATAGTDGSSMAIKTDGTLWGWGRSWARIADRNAGYRTGPFKISDDTDWKFVSSSNYYNSIAIKTDGSLCAWGTLMSNDYSGDWGEPLPLMEYGDTIRRIWSNTIWSSVYAKTQYAVASTPGGSLWAWGVNDTGQLGDGTTENRQVPVQINFYAQAVSPSHNYLENNTVIFSLEAVSARSFKLKVESGIFPHDIKSLSDHFLDISARSDRTVRMTNFEERRNSDTEITFTLYPGVPLYNTMTIAFKEFDFSLAIQGDPLAIEKWIYQTDPEKSSIVLQ
jgi:hypothetical protein